MFYRKEVDHVEPETLQARRRAGMKLLQGLLLVVFLLCGYKAYKGPNPWSRGITERVEAARSSDPTLDVKEMQTLQGWVKSEVKHPGVLKTKEHAAIGWWWAAVIGAGSSFLLLITLPLWMPGEEKEGDAAHDVPSADEENIGESGFAKLVSGRPVFFGLVILAVIVGGWMRAPRLDHSLWNDEEYAMRKYVHGDYKVGADGRPEFRPATWMDTLAENGNGNNHVLHSVLSRLSLGIWKGAWGYEDGKFSERWVRLPSYLAGLGTIFLVGLIGWEFGVAWIGIAAAWLMALHPWHVRYAVEGKGYSLMMFFMALCLLGLIQAQRNHSLRAWLMFAIGEAGFLASFSGAIYVAIALNAVALFEMVLRRQPRRIGSLVAFNLLAAIPVLWLMMPSVPQVLGFIAHDNSGRLPADTDWLRDLGAHLGAGVMYSNPYSMDHAGTSWETLRHSEPFVYGPLGWFLGLLVVLGVVTALFESAPSRFTILALVLAGGLGFWHARVQHHPNLSWYYLYLLFPLCLSVGLAVVRFQVVPAILTTAVIGAFGYATETPREIMRLVDRQPIRQTVDAIRAVRPHALTGVFGVSDKQAESYDPSVRVLTSVADLEAMLAEAQRTATAAFVYFAGDRESALRNRELYLRVTQSKDFERFKSFKGTEAMFSYSVYRCTGLGL